MRDGWHQYRSAMCARPSGARKSSRTFPWRSRTASSSSSSVRPAAGNRPASPRRRAGGPIVRRDLDRQRDGQQPAAPRARHRDGVPELRPLSAHDRRRQHRLFARASRHCQTRDREAHSGNPQSGPLSRALPAGTLRRPAPARRHGTHNRPAEVFLFDEPLSNLNAKLRVQMRVEILALRSRLDATTVYVTHDQVEAMTMADIIVVMRDGVIEQVGTPLELCDSPANTFVGGFLGSPSNHHGRRRAQLAADGDPSDRPTEIRGSGPRRRGGQGRNRAWPS